MRRPKPQPKKWENHQILIFFLHQTRLGCNILEYLNIFYTLDEKKVYCIFFNFTLGIHDA
ncbi:MAG: hypothetical protein MRERV_3c125 [Mycoplasmataceae bacterium RV_VA103A]|nr:MAG: hypothetical protein MRERV_3c125 [Mycoplasmataceae bacterium RV_VA103A]